MDEWPSCYWHFGLKVFCIVYVDDIKISGPAKSVDEAWHLVTNNIIIEDITPPGLFLGCQHRVHEVDHPTAKGRNIRVMEYDMEDQIRASVQL